jgi:hypothetical protein
MSLAILSDSPELVRVAMKFEENDIRSGEWEMLKLAIKSASLFALAEMLSHPSTATTDAQTAWRVAQHALPREPTDKEMHASSLIAIRANEMIPVCDMQKWVKSRRIRAQ